MKFTKMQGLGNDYVYVNCFKENVNDTSAAAKFVSNRHFGVGSDGLVLIMPSDKADFRMRMFNPDGSEAEMCGNAIRCVGKYVYDNNLTDKTTVEIETLAGVKVLDMTLKNGEVSLIKVDMGQPELKPYKIPVKSSKELFVSEPLILDGKTWEVTCVSMGNPHAVTFVANVDEFPIEQIGPKMENHSFFPERINAEFVQIIDKKNLKMRVWERGAGETLACGTGACAVLVASVLNDISARKATIKLLGGNLIVEWNQTNNHVFMTGPAVKVFDGEIKI